MTAYRHIAGFLGREETTRLLRVAEAGAHLLREVGSPAGFGPRYRVIDGETMRRQWPEIVAYGEGELRQTVERITGLRLRLMDSPKRAMHVQVYARPDDGFRWHFDGHTLAAMLTLRNSGGGATELISPRLSRWLRWPLYALYPWPRVFSLLPARRMVAEPGDLVILRGETVLHRGVRGDGGERWLLIFNYDEVGRRPNRLRDWLARRINY
ncbi:MAG: hypothetical protein ACRERC_00585 [Candidatus Binatia bacterium]